MIGAHKATRQRSAVLAAVLLSSYAIAMEITVVSAAIPTVIESFGGLSELSWVFSAYLVSQAVTIPLFGCASDRLGRRGCYVLAAMLFLAGTLACGWAWNMLSLVLFRMLQGAGGGGLVTVGMAALHDVIPQHARGRVQAMSSAVFGIAAISGPLVGTAIMHLLDWRFIFWINLPVVLASASLLAACYPGPAAGSGASRQRGLAALPSLYLCAALLAAMVALTHGHSLTRPQWLLCAAVGAPAAWLLLRSQRRSTDPLIPHALLRTPIVALAMVSAFLCGAIAMGMTVYVPSFTALVLQADYLTISSTVAVMTLSWTFSGIGIGLWMHSGQHRRLANLGAAGVLAGTLGLCQVARVAEHPWSVLVVLGLLGSGLGACSVAFSVTLQATVGDTVRGSATSLFYLSRMLGQAIGVALCGGVLAGSDEAARQLMQHSQQYADTPSSARVVADAGPLAASLRDHFVAIFVMLAGLALAQLLYGLFTPEPGRARWASDAASRWGAAINACAAAVKRAVRLLLRGFKAGLERARRVPRGGLHGRSDRPRAPAFRPDTAGHRGDRAPLQSGPDNP